MFFFTTRNTVWYYVSVMSNTVNSHEKTLINTKLEDIARAFNLNGDIILAEVISAGKVNHTYKVVLEDSLGNKKSYLFQEINTYVFKKPKEVMLNIDKIIKHIKRDNPNAICLELLYGSDCNNYYITGDTFWRIYKYIDSVSYNSSKDPKIVYDAGVAFGAFQRDLSKFDATLLYETIVDFHNTPKRFKTLKEHYEKDELGKAVQCKSETEYLFSMREKACILHSLYKNGKIPMRVTHNDTKINNVLFDKDTNDAICVIDLDTVMPGFTGHDFGDAVRSAANSMGSASLEFDKIHIDLDIFKAFAEGFLLKTKDVLTPAEISSLPDSCLVMTLELASRYIDDFITGDKYFKVTYPTQNLDRARNLIALAKDMDLNMPQMRQIISDLTFVK